jgi:nucleotide-binding universal stress UspA family protein
MATKEKILVALDDDATADEVVTYVAKMTSGQEGLAIGLLHFIPPLPPQLREFRGAEDPKTERQLDRELDVKCEQWTQDAERAAQALLRRATTLLTDSGRAAGSIETTIRQIENHEDLIDDLIGAAKENLCHTIVVGRSAFPWLKELFQRHIADELVRKASGMTIWVVEKSSPGK